MTFTDEQLTALLDGELPAEQARAITDALEMDAQLAARLESLHVDFTPIKAAFDGVLGQAPEIAIPEPVARGMNWRGIGNIAAATCVALVIGFTAGRQTAPAPQTGWIGAVAEYQGLYTKETLDLYGAENWVVEVAAVSQELGLDITLADLKIDGLAYIQGQILSYKDKPLAQFMFQTANGVPIAICVIKSDKPDRKMRIETPNGLNAAVWHKGGYGFIVIGDMEETDIRNLATQVSANI
jgi:anti-sigma factor RsiW